MSSIIAMVPPRPPPSRGGRRPPPNPVPLRPEQELLLETASGGRPPPIQTYERRALPPESQAPSSVRPWFRAIWGSFNWSGPQVWRRCWPASGATSWRPWWIAPRGHCTSPRAKGNWRCAGTWLRTLGWTSTPSTMEVNPYTMQNPVNCCIPVVSGGCACRLGACRIAREDSLILWCWWVVVDLLTQFACRDACL